MLTRKLGGEKGAGASDSFDQSLSWVASPEVLLHRGCDFSPKGLGAFLVNTLIPEYGEFLSIGCDEKQHTVALSGLLHF